MENTKVNHERELEIKKMADDLMHKNRHKLSLRDKKEFEKAMQKFLAGQSPKESIGLTQEREDYIYSQGYLLFQSGKYKQALDIFTLLYKFDNDSYKYLFSIAACQQHLKDYDAAGGNYLMCSELDRANPVPYFHRYDCFKKVNNPWAAFMMLLTCIELCKANNEYAVLLARAELELKGLKIILEKWAEENDKNTSKKE